MTRRGLFQIIGAAFASRKLPEMKAPKPIAFRGGRAEWIDSYKIMKLSASSIYGKFGMDINSAYPYAMTHGRRPA